MNFLLAATHPVYHSSMIHDIIPLRKFIVTPSEPRFTRAKSKIQITAGPDGQFE